GNLCLGSTFWFRRCDRGRGRTRLPPGFSLGRSTHMRDFYAVLLDEIPALLDRWHQQSGRPS
ncbi:MAG: hypothetical protein ACLQI9_01495, partial [Mycobacterium sp.]